MRAILLIAFSLALIVPQTWAQNTWISAPDMARTRQRHSATLMADGKLFVSGGAYDFWGEAAANTCEIYDPWLEVWSNTASMSVARSSHTATLLPNGKILVTGGYNGGGYALSSAEIYDPTTDTWTTSASMSYGRYRHQAVVLNSDSILIVGGRQGNVDGGGAMNIWAPVSTCEIYRISDDTWFAAAPLNETRVESGLAMLPDGRVLAAGGINDTLIISDWGQPASRTCEVYDPVVDTWTYTDSLASARNFVRLVTLDNNSVLSIGGEFDQYALPDCQLYDASSSTWIAADSLVDPRIVTEPVKLPNGDVISVGGWHYLWDSQTSTAEYYVVNDNHWEALPTMSVDRGWHTATMLGNGDILVAGGTTARGEPLKSCEIYRVNQDLLFSIAAISDLPADEGGAVRVFWNPHPSDRAGASSDVASYSVYLSDEAKGTAIPVIGQGKWRLVATRIADGLRRYNANAASLETSTIGSLAESQYVVVANMKNDTKEVTPPASGVSFDNRGPARVANVRSDVAQQRSTLSWQRPSSDDVDRYEVYRGSTPTFPLDRASLIATTTDPTYDVSGASGVDYYRIRAIDRNSNAGLASVPLNAKLSDASSVVTLSNKLTVGLAYPLPAQTSAIVPVTIAYPASATITVYDHLSRVIASMSHFALSTGTNNIRLDLTRMPNGVYMCSVSVDGVSRWAAVTVAR